MLQVACALAESHDVSLQVDGREACAFECIRAMAHTRFGFDLTWIKPLRVPFGIARPGESVAAKMTRRFGSYVRSAGFDLSVATSLSVPDPSLATVSWCIIQFPMKDPRQRTLFPQRVLSRWLRCSSKVRVLCYSEFSRRWIEKRLGVNATVLAPPVAPVEAEPWAAKENLILSVGRFFLAEHDKRQDALIEAFHTLAASLGPGWQLVLAGGLTAGHEAHLLRLQSKAEGLNVRFAVNIAWPELVSLYRRAKLFWSATGFEVNESEAPERCEHFGISVVEAMSAGDVPLVVANGGPAEIIHDNINGLTWRSIPELIDKSLGLLNRPERWQVLSVNARSRSRDFASEVFVSRLLSLAREDVG